MNPDAMDLPIGTDIEMIEALLAHMQQNQVVAGGGAPHMYDDMQDDDDDDDYDDDDEEDDEDDYYGGGGGGGGEQININMYQNPYGGAGVGDVTDQMLQGLQGLQGLQNLLSMSGAGGDIAAMAGSAIGGALDVAGGNGAAGYESFSNMSAALAGAFSAAGPLMDGLQSHQGGATIQEYDDDDDDEEDDEDISEGSGSEEDEEDDEESEGEEEHVGHGGHGGHNMSAMAAMSGLSISAGGGMAAVAAMMAVGNASQQGMYNSPRPHMMPQHPSPYSMAPTAVSGHPSVTSAPQPSIMSKLTAAAGVAAAATAAAAALSHTPSSSVPPAAMPSGPSAPIPHSAPAVGVPPQMSISSSMGGGTMARVDPLAALAAGATGGAVAGTVIGKMVSCNNTGGGTTVVKPLEQRILRPSATPSPALNKTAPFPSVHKSMDELNKLTDSFGKANISAHHMSAITSQSVHSLIPPTPQQHQIHAHHAQQQAMAGAPPHPMMYPGQLMMPGMMVRPPMPNMPAHTMIPAHMPNVAPLARNNDSDKNSLDRESDRGSDGSGGGKSDTESTKKTPSPPLVGPGRVSPDSSSGSSSSSGSHVKNAASLASLSDLPSATESMRDSDTDHHIGEQQMHQLQRHLRQLDHDSHRGPGFLLPGPIPLLIETPGYGWSSLVGHETAKDALKNLFQGKDFPEVFDSQGSCRGVLLFGPSGAGKTSLARSLAYEAGGAKLIACTPAFVINTNIHPVDAATLIRQMFDHARVHKPCVMLMDEIELLARPDLPEAGAWAKAELMAQVRGETTLKPAYPQNSKHTINDNVMLVATTASPWYLPTDLRRLFAYNIFIKLPGEKQREELFRMFLNNSANNVTSDQYKCILSKSDGYSAADIHTVVRQASYNPPTQQNGDTHMNHPRVVTFDDLASVMTTYKCLYKQEHLVFYKKYIQEATHRTEDMREEAKKDKTKGSRKLGRFAKTIASAFISVID